MMLILGFIVILLYVTFLTVVSIYFFKYPITISDFEADMRPVSIIICARNEEKTIAKCLHSISEQDYPKHLIEIILVNDASSDKTKELAEIILIKLGVSFQIISNQIKLGKKKSLLEAISKAKHHLIITRDADTFTKSKVWLNSMVNYHLKYHKDFVIGPVMISDNVGLIWALQAIESNILTMFSLASLQLKKPFLCSGANLLFTKALFQETNGYKSHLEIESGDDVLFLEDVKKKRPQTIGAVKSTSAIVYTYPQRSFSQLLNQRIRWAKKFDSNPNKANLIIAFAIMVVNAFWLFNFVTYFFVQQNGYFGLIFILLKLIIDSLLLFLASRFVNNKGLNWYILPIGLIYPVYALVVAIASVIFKPKWK